MKNTSENKANLFAHYWWQEVCRNNSSKKHFSVDGASLGTPNIQKNYLELLPVSKTTDEDAIEVAKMLGWIEHDADVKIEQALDFINGGDDSCTLNSYCSVVDFLRSKGYALPWMGLSVEEQVNYGWVKLK